ncbi:4,5-DOPA-extradiol-dioxygenase [Phaeocystidibacter luteus]|uniref:4,5-DOPA dioxygenase extradiol n=1 Tax=Phaeocystidibacter luteus TaxID=911197 RepID=A0A6N6RCP7_9FLAO|nr:4,5-DOPA dioxygenase extradiol [Phaeocystidibacter luteus]KAB2805405.1 4,5-DOPA dioxygenase extradiol [Phaeocystidibacter luteus]
MGISTLLDLEKLSDHYANSERMPAMFVGHGSPMNAIEQNEFTRGFAAVANALPHPPKAILCVSAHWFTQGTRVLMVEQPETIHDFGGFPRELYDVEYPANGHPELAKETLDLLAPDAHADEQWGLDHGTWSVLNHMYPDADVPVFQLSIDYTKDADHHFELASKLRSLRDKGVLIVGSGNIVHNLGELDWSKGAIRENGYDWALEARAQINALLLDGNFAPLLDYTNQGLAWRNSIPTPDHFLPLLYALGAKHDSEELEIFNDKVLMGSISMTSIITK